MAWKAAFDQEIASKKAHEEEEKLKSLNAKEREEWRKAAMRLTGDSIILNNDVCTYFSLKRTTAVRKRS